MSWTNRKRQLTIVTLLLIVVLGILNFLTGYEISFSIFYLIPIAFALWRVGKRFAMVAAFVSATVWYISDLATGHPFSHPMIPLWNASVSLGFFIVFIVFADRWKTSYEEQQKLVVDLKKALEDIKILSGLIPICAWCKNVRNDAGYWQQVETFVQDRSDATFTHSICPDCMEKWKRDKGISQ